MTSIQRTDAETHMDSENGVPTPRLNVGPIINQLPIELLLQIFEFALGPRDHDHGSEYYRHLCTLSGVCTRWYSIIHHSPQLWTIVPGIIKEEGLRKILERSSGKHIDIKCNHKEVHFPTYFNVLGSASERWRSLGLTTSRTVALEHQTHDFLQLPAPNLERLSFENSHWYSVNMRNVEFFRGNCPNLKEIHISGVTCEWTQPAFKGLEILKLSYVFFDSVGPILDLIRPLSQLRKLEIHKCKTNEELPEPTQPVSLPNLQLLRVEFNDQWRVKIPTKQFLDRISAPPACPLYVSLDNYEPEEEGSVAETFCEWLFGRQTKAVLEGVEGLKLDFSHSDDDMSSLVTFKLHSGSAKINGGFTSSHTEDGLHVLEYIQGLFQRSSTLEGFTELSVSGNRAEILNNSEIIASFKGLPPITHLELIQPEWFTPSSPSEDISDSEGLDSSTAPYSKIKNVVLWEVPPDRILDIVFGALGDSRERTPLISEWRVEDLDHVEIHVDGRDFHEAEAVVVVLRNDPRIGKVDLYVAL
ncbi:hypothetical protein FRC01_002794 [Tulasnella sp. 417]|nr:hypothetical protein FRC01_002794 [Tulasnella sp. 417]